MADIGLSPPGIKPYPVRGGNSTSTGLTYGIVAVADNGTNNFRDVKAPAGALATAVVGPVTTRNAAGSSGEAIELGDRGSVCEVWLAANSTCNKEDVAVVANSSGHVRAENAGVDAYPYDVVGRFKQNATAGANPILVACEIAVQKKTA